MRVLFLHLALLAVACAYGQGLLLNESFEATGGTALPPGWSWIGNAPTYVTGAGGTGFGIAKESPDLSVSPLEYGALLFHPLTYNPSWLYRITGYMYVGGPGASTAAAGAMLCWVDLATGQFVSGDPSITSFSQGSWEQQFSLYSTHPGNTIGPNAQFGVMLVCGIGDGNAFAAFDNITVNSTLPWVQVQAKAWLDGAYEQGANLMRDDLRVAGLIPASEPYSAIYGGPGGETAAPSVLAVTGNNAIVDWVRIELRASPSGPAVATAHALLQRDGDIVSVDGASPVRFFVGAGLYHVVLRHRNHLGVMTASALSMGLFGTWSIDFRASATNCYTRPAPFTDLPRKTTGTTRTLWSANVIADDRLKYVGSANDRDPILLAIGGSTPTNTVAGYLNTDVNMDGVIRYIGTNNDRDPILLNIGGSTPTAVRIEQVT